VANRLRRRHDPHELEITVVDQDDRHVYQPGLLFVPFGLTHPEDIVRPRHRQLHDGIGFRQVAIDHVDQTAEQVHLADGSVLGYDVLILATGAVLVPEETEGLTGPGWMEKVFTFYSPEGAAGLREALASFDGGRVVVNVVDMPIKCPVAPLEFCFLADWYFQQLGIRDRVDLTYVTPLDGAFTKPVASRAGRWSVDGLLGTVENLRMESVAAEKATDVKPFGLEKPLRSVGLVLKDGSTRTLEIGAGAPDPTATPAPSPSPAKAGAKPEPMKPTKYYARQAGNGLVAVVPATLADDLAKGMGELRAKRLLEVATYETEGFEVVAGGAKRTYAKSTSKDKDGFDKTQWKRTAPDAKDLETTKVEDALFKMGGVEVAEFVDAPQPLAVYGLDAPVLKVTVKAKGESWIEVAKKDAAVYARRSGDSAVLKLDPAKAEELLKAFGEL